jgi:calcium/calmodulin-dependent protein kinase (CaM kinase) II
MKPDAAVAELIDLTQRLLKCIAEADWETYSQLCDPTLSAFEPESLGHLVEGLEFHRFYFNLGAAEGPVNVTLSSPKVRLMGDVAIVSYARLVQRLDEDGVPVTRQSAETRVWQRRDGAWRHVHFHRSVS